MLIGVLDASEILFRDQLPESGEAFLEMCQKLVENKIGQYKKMFSKKKLSLSDSYEYAEKLFSASIFKTGKQLDSIIYQMRTLLDSFDCNPDLAAYLCGILFQQLRTLPMKKRSIPLKAIEDLEEQYPNSLIISQIASRAALQAVQPDKPDQAERIFRKMERRLKKYPYDTDLCSSCAKTILVANDGLFISSGRELQTQVEKLIRFSKEKLRGLPVAGILSAGLGYQFMEATPYADFLYRLFNEIALAAREDPADWTGLAYGYANHCSQMIDPGIGQLKTYLNQLVELVRNDPENPEMIRAYAQGFSSAIISADGKAPYEWLETLQDLRKQNREDQFIAEKYAEALSAFSISPEVDEKTLELLECLAEGYPESELIAECYGTQAGYILEESGPDALIHAEEKLTEYLKKFPAATGIRTILKNIENTRKNPYLSEPGSLKDLLSYMDEDDPDFEDEYGSDADDVSEELLVELESIRMKHEKDPLNEKTAEKLADLLLTIADLESELYAESSVDELDKLLSLFPDNTVIASSLSSALNDLLLETEDENLPRIVRALYELAERFPDEKTIVENYTDAAGDLLENEESEAVLKNLIHHIENVYKTHPDSNPAIVLYSKSLCAKNKSASAMESASILSELQDLCENHPDLEDLNKSLYAVMADHALEQMMTSAGKKVEEFDQSENMLLESPEKAERYRERITVRFLSLDAEDQRKILNALLLLHKKFRDQEQAASALSRILGFVSPELNKKNVLKVVKLLGNSHRSFPDNPQIAAGYASALAALSAVQSLSESQTTVSKIEGLLYRYSPKETSAITLVLLGALSELAARQTGAAYERTCEKMNELLIQTDGSIGSGFDSDDFDESDTDSQLDFLFD